MLLCVAGASRWMLSAAVPATSSTLASEAAGCGGAAVLAYLFGVRPATRPAFADMLRAAVAGAMLLGGPMVGLLIGARGLEANSLVIALALVPVVVGVAQTAVGTSSGDSFAGRIWPGLAAAGGLLLVLPEPSLSGVRNDVALVLAPLLTGTGVALYGVARRELKASSALSGAALAFTLALLVAFATHNGPHGAFGFAAMLDAGFALLALRAMGNLGGTRWSAQFVLVPLAVIVEGLFVLRPGFDLRTSGALVLLVLGTLFLLLPQADEGVVTGGSHQPLG